MTALGCECGEPNPPDARFCRHCGGYLWDADESTPDPATRPAPPRDNPEGRTTVLPVERNDPKASARPAEVSRADAEVVIDPRTGGVLNLKVTNPSSLVEGYRCEALDPPPWLSISGSTVGLLPDADAALPAEVKIRSERLAVAQKLPLRLRIRTLSDESKYADVTVTLTVPPVGDFPAVRAEPAALRLRDTTRGQFTLHIDNRDCNHPRRCVLSGTDEEGVVRFTFTPPVVEVGPEGRATVGVQLALPPLDPGTQSNRRVTVTVADGDERADASVSVIHQSAAADPPVRLRLEPSLLRTLDRHSAEVGVVVDNRVGRNVRRVVLRGRDPENRIQFTPRVTEVTVAPGGEAKVRMGLAARVPDPGTEVSQAFIVQAGDGSQESEVSGTWLQAASRAPITTAGVRLEPEHLRVRDQEYGRFTVLVDNERGAWPLRVRLGGADPEGVMGFQFHPPVLDIPPGGSVRGLLAVTAPLPPPGQTATRQFRVRARDENGSVDASGVFDQTSSATPLSTARLALDPEQIVAGHGRSGQTTVRLDNRAGMRNLQARLTGVDPQRAMRFAVNPSMVDIPPGQVGVATVTVQASRPEGRQQTVRPFAVVADDGNASIHVDGSIAQSGRDWMPIIRVVLTLLGALLVALGAFQPWLSVDGRSDLPSVSNITNSVDTIAGSVASQPPGSPQDAGMLLQAAEPIERTAVLLMAVLMAFGLTGQRGKLTRMTSLIVVLTMLVAGAFWLFVGTGDLAGGAFLVVLGGIVGYVGGRSIRR